MRRGGGTGKAKKGKSRTNEEEGHWVKTLDRRKKGERSLGKSLDRRKESGREGEGTTVKVHIYVFFGWSLLGSMSPLSGRSPFSQLQEVMDLD